MTGSGGSASSAVIGTSAGTLSDLAPRRVVRQDIATRADIAGLLADFYARAFADPLIGPIFTDVAHLDLPRHLPIMCDFWETVLLGTRTYRRNAFVAHRRLSSRHQLTPAHFARWLALWAQTVEDRHAGPVAERAKLQAGRIAASMSRRLDPYRQRQHRDAASATAGHSPAGLRFEE